MHTLSDIHLQFATAFRDPRIRPAAYLLSKKLQEGNTCVPVDSILSEELPFEHRWLPDPVTLPELVGTPDSTPKPFIRDGHLLYFQRYHHYESQIIRHVVARSSSSLQLLQERMAGLQKHQSLIASLSATYPLDGLLPEEKCDWQLVACLQALLSDFSIITGGPGTGKTTTLAKLLRIIYAMNPATTVALAAPTGKASMRMYESLRQSAATFPEMRELFDQLKPSTLHTLLGYKPGSIHFKYNSKNALPFNWVVVDEASMIDVPMFAKLLDAMDTQTRIILLGDKDQLASVEAGSLLGDLCAVIPSLNGMSAERSNWINQFLTSPERQIPVSGSTEQLPWLSNHILQLKLSHRFKKRGAIGILASCIIRGETTELKEMMSDHQGEELQFDNSYNPAVLEAFCEGYADFIGEADISKALEKLNNLRVLVAVREGEKGLYAINRQIEQILRQKHLLKPDREFYLNRPVMVTKNNYELNLFNGDVGLLRPNAQGELRAWFLDSAGELRNILPAYLSDAETVFAMTIHKSQGSEFNQVMVILPEGTDNPLLTRELLYTAVTRAKQSVTIQGSTETLLHTLSRSVNRISGITERITQINLNIC
jgi:exodeoxyribonuclease V alpha subunit